MKFYEPKEFRTQHKSNRQASNEECINPEMGGSKGLTPPFPYSASQAVVVHHQRSLELYDKLIERGVCREQARGVLPQNLYTEYYGTVNLNNLMKFIELRSHDGAQWEIQKVAEACLQIAEGLFPTTVAFYKEIRENS